MKCILCERNKFINIAKKDSKSSEKLIVSMCYNCGLIQQNPLPTSEELRIYYSHNYRNDYKKTYSPKLKHVFRAGNIALGRIKFLEKYGLHNGTLLDIGAGGGEFVYLSEKFGFKSNGIEPSIGYSEYSKKEYGAKILTGELNDVIGTYDIITMFHVLEHLPSPIKAFEKLYFLLNKNGQLLIEVPWIETNDASPDNIYFKAHLFYFSIDTLISCASQYFDILNIDTSSNLKILFIVKEKPTLLKLPTEESVNKLRTRVMEKGWLEYLFKGKGLLKPIYKFNNSIKETKIKNLTPKEILDTLFKKYYTNH